jgi:hypothetical protein
MPFYEADFTIFKSSYFLKITETEKNGQGKAQDYQ